MGVSKENQKLAEYVVSFGAAVMGGWLGIVGYIGFSAVGYAVDHFLE